MVEVMFTDAACKAIVLTWAYFRFGTEEGTFDSPAGGEGGGVVVAVGIAVVSDDRAGFELERRANK